MHGHDSFSISVFPAFPMVKESSRAAKKEFLVDLRQFVLPEFVLVQDVSSEELRGDAARQVLYGFPDCCQYVDPQIIESTNPVKPPSIER
jgi:hypothetical protein